MSRKKKRLSAEFRRLEKERKAQIYRERDLKKVEAKIEGIPEVKEAPSANKYARKQKRLEQKRKQKEAKKLSNIAKREAKKEAKRKAIEAEASAKRKAIEAEASTEALLDATKDIIAKTQKVEEHTPGNPPPKPALQTSTGWRAKHLFENIEAMELGLTTYIDELQTSEALDYKGDLSGNRYAEAAKLVYTEIESGLTNLRFFKDILTRFTKLNIPLNEKTIGEEWFRKLNEQWSVASKFFERFSYEKYEDKDGVHTGTNLNSLRETAEALLEIVGAFTKMGLYLERGAESKGLRI